MPSLIVVVAIDVGGAAGCIQHLAMRMVLYQIKQIPEIFYPIIKETEDRLFIYRTGGSNIFAHRYLQEHFATLSFDET